MGPGRRNSWRLWAVALLPAVALPLLARSEVRCISSIAFGPGGQTIATVSGGRGAGDFEVRVWDLGTRRERRRDRLHFAEFPLVVSSDGARLEVRPSASPTTLRDLTSWPARTLLGGSTSGTGGWRAVLSEDGRLLATTRMDQTDQDAVRVWDATTGRLVRRMSDGEPVDHLRMSRDAKILAGVRGSLVLWDLEHGVLITSPRLNRPLCLPVAISPDGSMLAAAVAGGTEMVDVASLRSRAVIKGHTDVGLAFSPDGRRLVIGDADRHQVRVHDTADLRLICTYEGHRTPTHVAAARRLSWETGINPLGWTDNSIWDVAVSPDGRLAASCDVDGSARVWEAETAREVAAFMHEDGGLSAWNVGGATAWFLAVLAIGRSRARMKTVAPARA